MMSVMWRAVVYSAGVIVWSCGAAGAQGQELDAPRKDPVFKLNVFEGGAKDGAERDFVSGTVVTTHSGERRVLAKGRGREEVWKVGVEGAIEDTGYLSWPVEGRTVRVEWESAKAREWPLEAGGRLPWKATGERFEAFQVTDWLIGRTDAVALPFLGGEDIAFRFRAGGVVTAKRKVGEDARGDWWWSRGLLHVRLEGLEDAATYEWRALARHVGWTKDMVAPVQPETVVDRVAETKGKTRWQRSLPGGVFGCPRDVLNRLLVSATDRSDVVAALALEKETLELCAERQRLVAEIVNADIGIEKMLKEAEGPKGDKPSAAILRTVEELVSAPGRKQAVGEKGAEVKEAVGERKTKAGVGGGEGETAGVGKGKAVKPVRPVVAFTWFTMLGTPGKLVAGVTDGRRSWFVREGAVLPDGGLVTGVSSKPPRVKVAGRGLLPWSSRPPAGGGDDEGDRQGAESRGSALQSKEGLSGDIVGHGRAIDGDTLDIGGVRVRLSGVDAPEKRQTCRTGANVWSCGGLAAAALRSRSGEIRCERRGRDEYGSVVARCVEGGLDIGAWLVSEGWALAHGPGSGGYLEVQEGAKADKKGIHRGDYVVPWEWRRGRRLKPVGEAVTGGDGRAGLGGSKRLLAITQEGVAR